MVKTVVIHAHGGPEVLRLEDRPLPRPGPGEILLRHKAIGVNFIDIYQRTGLYPLSLPAVLGREGAGVVEAVGEGVEGFRPGDRVAYVGMGAGAYTEARLLPAEQVVPLPSGIDFETAAAMMLKGLTVHYLFQRTTPLNPGDTVLFHAAAGGVGLIACQWARALGIRLIATAGSDDKCALALEHGATHAINYRSQDFVAEVRRLTEGRGVDVVMDSVGAATWEGSLDCLRPLGMMISFGNASGPVPPLNLQTLAAKGSLKVTRPTLFTHISDKAVYRQMAADLFKMVLSGAVKIHVGERFPLDAVAEAHSALESRRTIGSLVLLPS